MKIRILHSHMRKIIILPILLLLILSCSNNAPKVNLADFKVAEELTLSYWIPVPKYAWYRDFLYEELEKVTGIHIDFKHTKTTSPEAQFAELTALSASGNLPDIIEWNWLKQHPEGIDSAINNGMILPLQEHVIQYAPNFYKVISRNEDISRSVSTPSGNIYGFPSLLIDTETRAVGGLLIRRRWLEQLEINIPETIEDWRFMLRLMKETDFGTLGSAPEYPFCFPAIYEADGLMFFEESNFFAGSWGVSHGMYRNKKGEIIYGPIQSGYLNMLTELNSWYEEGLIHPALEGPLQRQTRFLKIMMKCGATYGTYDVLSDSSTSSVLDYVPAPPPRLEGEDTRGAQLKPVHTGLGAAAISAESENAIAAVRYLDVLYSDWGKTLFNFGIEGEIYEYANDIPVLIDNILESKILHKYSRWFFNINGPFEQSGILLEQIRRRNLNETVEDNPWLSNAEQPVESIINYDPIGNSEYQSIMIPIKNHVNNGFMEFVNGSRSLWEFDNFVKEVENLGLSKAVSLLNSAYADFYSKPVY